MDGRFDLIQAVYVQNTIMYIQLTHKCSAGPSLETLFVSVGVKVEFGVIGVDWCHVVGGPIIFALRGVLVICE